MCKFEQILELAAISFFPIQRFHFVNLQISLSFQSAVLFLHFEQDK